MLKRKRREFLSNVGKGVMVASIGTALATELWFAPAIAGGHSNSWMSAMTPRGMQIVRTVRLPIALCFTPRGTYTTTP